MPTEIVIEALYRGLRAVSLITGLLVFIDACGILIKPFEHPPHKPKWNAASWLTISGVVAFMAGYFIFAEYDLVKRHAPPPVIFAPIIMYFGMIAGFSIRAISRAHRPWFTAISTLCMCIAAVGISWWDLVIK